MKKVITMVGTSIFENYFEEESEDKISRGYFEDLQEKRAKEFDLEKGKIQSLRDAIKEWIGSRKDKGRANLSAEVKSLLKLKEELKDDDFEVYLLYSDTILSKLASQLIEEILQDLGFDSKKIYTRLIKCLQVQDREEFNTGMSELINEIYRIADEYWDNVIINITGGYKATIPYLTILAQVNKCPVYYIFEKTDALIKIPYIPLDIKWEIFEKNEEFFTKLERDGVSELKGINEEDYADVLSLVEKVENLYSLNNLGIVLWEKYKRGFRVFYVSGLFKEYIGKDQNFRNIAEKSLLELKRRIEQNPQDPDLDHRLEDVDLQGFKCFKHKESNLQVRILYKAEERKTRYGAVEYDIYAGAISIGSDVHNVESEYIETFKRNLQKIKDLGNYEVYKIQKEG
ncbi:CRISPR-associated protein, APE2256 family [Candidatus Kryptonium thompsonii]|jgi:putative CRISPR-associated protein (TIGR02619 family)|uniref:CRISPR-associated protein, APE2256 family n=2 Tax=Candidatus Kryptonium thompsonii TaxID=1633631 RepID=A0ABM9UZ99_9BACT|nr:putative CRISPR-associated protein [Candidatus Kryptonium thompsoni]CUS76888.1 CRISPR-associated protein, APE2256 family [Candidatus Kryptonium thompsoni]CUS79396.1 CRISPR-associated protein, APE2256 family [Candidatus Kryptonium thompsoni]CUS85947.1 CRISPR-associated protein, APE2256 family [Candidatus Kryptonium thompsoni]CUS92586.1 CRISPR-associated protein, APE2256 family [Candidatus Kryptonium thompsoni]CUS92731.1 CRISPR-associated protein, APE2256 family [Candidatus Kryptonium thompso